MNHKQEELEKELDELYHKGIGLGDGIMAENPLLKYYKQQIAGFLSSKLSEQAKSIIEEINLLEYKDFEVPEHRLAYKKGWNKALDEVIKIIKDV